MQKSFKKFLYEGGFPFSNIYNDKMVNLFGNTEQDLVAINKKKKTKKSNKISINKRQNNKLVAYMRYAKLIND